MYPDFPSSTPSVQIARAIWGDDLLATMQSQIKIGFDT